MLVSVHVEHLWMTTIRSIMRRERAQAIGCQQVLCEYIQDTLMVAGVQHGIAQRNGEQLVWANSWIMASRTVDDIIEITTVRIPEALLKALTAACQQPLVGQRVAFESASLSELLWTIRA